MLGVGQIFSRHDMMLIVHTRMFTSSVISPALSVPLAWSLTSTCLTLTA